MNSNEKHKWLQVYVELQNKDPRLLDDKSLSYIYVSEFGVQKRVSNIELYKKALDELLDMTFYNEIPNMINEISTHAIDTLEEEDRGNIYLLLKFIKNINEKIQNNG